jgi:flagella basal body P-ring formation protein FlgA
MRKIALGTVFFYCATSAAQTPVPPRQSIDSIKSTIENFVKKETLSLSGIVAIDVGYIDSRIMLVPCTNISAAVPAGNKLWGRTTVAVHCTTPASWTIYVPVSVKIQASYLIAKKNINTGQLISDNDLDIAFGDVTRMTRGYLTEPQQASGRVAAMQITANTPLRSDSFKQVNTVQAGQSVRIRIKGSGFSVIAGGVAMTSASKGQPVQAKTSSGHLVRGTATEDGMIDAKN